MTEQITENHDDEGRRAFLKKMAIGGAFAAPVVSSFSMTGVSAAYAQTPTASGTTATTSDVGNTGVTAPPQNPTTTTQVTTTTMMANGNTTT